MILRGVGVRRGSDAADRLAGIGLSLPQFANGREIRAVFEAGIAEIAVELGDLQLGFHTAQFGLERNLPEALGGGDNSSAAIVFRRPLAGPGDEKGALASCSVRGTGFEGEIHRLRLA